MDSAWVSPPPRRPTVTGRVCASAASPPSADLPPAPPASSAFHLPHKPGAPQGASYLLVNGIRSHWSLQSVSSVSSALHRSALPHGACFAGADHGPSWGQLPDLKASPGVLSLGSPLIPPGNIPPHNCSCAHAFGIRSLHCGES